MQGVCDEFDKLVYGGRGPRLWTEQFSVVANANRTLYRVLKSDFTGANLDKEVPADLVYEGGGVMTPDALYHVSKEDNTYQVSEPITPWSKNGPIRYYSAHDGYWKTELHWPLYSPYIDHGPNRYERVHNTERAPVRVNRGMFDGVPVFSRGKAATRRPGEYRDHRAFAHFGLSCDCP